MGSGVSRTNASKFELKETVVFITEQHGEMHHSPGAGAGSEIMLKLRWGVVRCGTVPGWQWPVLLCLPVAAHTCGGWRPTWVSSIIPHLIF